MINLVQFAGSTRLHEIACMTSKRLSIAAGQKQELLSFQHVLAPLLAVLFQPDVYQQLAQASVQPYFHGEPSSLELP